jgi:D-inositol-3-phosphate glycosyltransferase
MLRIGIVMYETSLTKGQELVAQRMVKEFRALNYDAFLITSPYHDGEAVISDEELKVHGGFSYIFDERLGLPVIRVASVASSWPPRRASLMDFIDALGKIVDNFKLNVLITHSTLWNGPEEILKFIQWRRNLAQNGVPSLNPVFCHMSHFQEASAERYQILERSFREAWDETSLRQIVREADLIIVVSPREKEIMKARGATDSKCFLFPGGIEELTGVEYEPSKLLLSLGIPDKTKVVTSLGTIEERKNSLNVVEVARRLLGRPDVRFVIAGLEQGEYGRRVREEASKLPNVYFLGAISDADKSSLIRRTDINIIMSRSEALGITQLEFMSNGVPVVSSGSGGQEWLVENGVNGIVVGGPDDTAGAARAIETLVDDDQLRKRLGKNAARNASRFSMTRLVNDLAKRLEGLVSKRSGDGRLSSVFKRDEPALEAMLVGKTRAIVTERQLVVKNDGKGSSIVSIRIADISKIIRRDILPWRILVGGILASSLLFVSSAARLPPDSYLLALPSSAAFLGLWLAPVVPLGVAYALFRSQKKEGYLILSRSTSIFLPKEFLRVIKAVDRLTPRDVLEKKEMEPVQEQASSFRRLRRD